MSSHRVWTREAVLAAFHAFEAKHGRSPSWDDWNRATPFTPHANTVLNLFGSFKAARFEANEDSFLKQRLGKTWTRDEVVNLITQWVFLHGRPPYGTEWHVPPPGYPSARIVASLFGSWNGAIIAAGYRPKWMHRSVESYRASMAHVTKREAA